MKKYFVLFKILFLACVVRAQDKDTIEVQKIGDKYFVIVDRQKQDSAIQAAVKTATAPKPFDSHFMVVGLGTVGFANTWTKTISGGIKTKLPVTNTFGNDPQFEFSPMLLWRHSNNLLVEFEPSFDGTSLGVNWACITYYAHPGVMIRAGYLVLPFGTYNKRLAAGWINKLATDPVGVTNGPVSSDWGIEMQGGLPCGNMKVSYDIALTNGFQVMGDGSLSNPGITDSHLGKTVSGRFGWVPAMNSGFELGISGLWGRADSANTSYVGAQTVMGAADAQYVYSGKHAVLNLKGQYNMQYVTSQMYANPGYAGVGDSIHSPTYTYKNLSMGWYAMVSVRPVAPSKFVRSLEFAARYSAYDNPKGASWEGHTQQITAGICYWLNWRTVFKITYENLMTSNPSNDNLAISDLKTIQNILYAQFSVQF